MLRPIIGEQVEMRTSLLPDLDKVVADPGQMEQVIMNLVLNARDAMPRGGRICMKTSNGMLDADAARAHGMAPGPCVNLSISDTGEGIETGALEHVFEPFFTTKERGTGLGLNTVRRIIQRSAAMSGSRASPGAAPRFSSACRARRRR
jgi:signal transduction histidine kinase